VSETNDKRLEDDPGLEDYLRRESAVSQRYRELEADDVPPQLDAAVIARARAAIATSEPSKRKPTWMKWAAPLALAASAVMVVAIVLEVGVQDEVRVQAPQVDSTASEPPPLVYVAPPDVLEEAPRAEMAPVAPAPAPPAESAPAKKSEARKVTSEVAPADSRVTTDLSRANAPTPQFASSALDSARGNAEVTDVPAAASRSTPITVTSAPAAAPAPAPTAQVPRLPPEAWLESIRTLRREGKVIEADQQWREFRESYPQFEVSETDLARPKP
jgi:hypothetical protein